MIEREPECTLGSPPENPLGATTPPYSRFVEEYSGAVSRRALGFVQWCRFVNWNLHLDLRRSWVTEKSTSPPLTSRSSRLHNQVTNLEPTAPRGVPADLDHEFNVGKPAWERPAWPCLAIQVPSDKRVHQIIARESLVLKGAGPAADEPRRMPSLRGQYPASRWCGKAPGIDRPQRTIPARAVANWASVSIALLFGKTIFPIVFFTRP